MEPSLLSCFQYFVFDFFAYKEIFFDKVIRLTVSSNQMRQIMVDFTPHGCFPLSICKVMHSKMLRSFCIGSFKLDVWTVYKQPGRHYGNVAVVAYIILPIQLAQMLILWQSNYPKPKIKIDKKGVMKIIPSSMTKQERLNNIERSRKKTLEA